jgi:hypothetical protein
MARGSASRASASATPVRPPPFFLPLFLSLPLPPPPPFTILTASSPSRAWLVCVCVLPGIFGADCALSLDSEGKEQLLASYGYKERITRPHIYVYELPNTLTTW